MSLSRPSTTRLPSGVRRQMSPRAVPAVGGEGAGVLLGRPVVAARRVGPAGEQRAGPPVGDVPVQLVDEADLVARRSSAGPGSRRRRRRGRPGACSSAAPRPCRRPAAAGPRARARSARATSSASRAPPTWSTAQAAQLARPRAPAAWWSQRWATAGTAAVAVTPSVSIVANGTLGLGRREHHDPAAVEERPEDARAGEREVVRCGQRDEVDGGGVEPADLRAAAGVVDVVVVGAGDELGQAGGPPGEEEHRDVARVRRVGVPAGVLRRPRRPRRARRRAQ